MMNIVLVLVSDFKQYTLSAGVSISTYKSDNLQFRKQSAGERFYILSQDFSLRR
jgi:hypothetical protein